MWSCWSLSSWIWGGVLGDISNTCGSGRIQLKPWGEEGWHSSFGVAERGPEHRQGWVLKPKRFGIKRWEACEASYSNNSESDPWIWWNHDDDNLEARWLFKVASTGLPQERYYCRWILIVFKCEGYDGMTLQGSLWTHWSLFLHLCPGVTRVIMSVFLWVISQATWGHHPYSQAGEAREITCDHQRGDGRFVEMEKGMGWEDFSKL